VKRIKEHKHHQAGMKNLPKAGQVAGIDSWKYYGALVIILLISFFIYLPVLHNGFVWDDEYYIENNPLIYSINLKEIFSQNVLGNYHPFTILTLAIEYHFFGLNETGYHAVNLLLHLLNVILVFYTVFFLSEKAGVALVASLLFGIHPIHVESVAWVAELKDLLYTFFFLASYFFYLKYLKNLKIRYYVFALALFSVSILSKAMAASLPLLLVLTDYLKGRKITKKSILEKVPFFLLAIALGVVAIIAQKSTGAISDLAIFTLPQRLVFASYGFITYLFKLLLPLNLSAFYPYPIKSYEDIPIQYYAYIFIFSVLVAYVIYSLRFTQKIFFGIGFFAITVLLVLQLLPVGGAIIADRYAYIPSIGIFYLAGEGINLLWNKKLKFVVIILLSASAIFFSVKTHARCGIWKNEMALWNDVISQYQTVPRIYYNRGNVFMNEKNYDRAIGDYSKAIELNPNYAEAYYNRGIVYMNEKNYDRAIRDYSKAIELNPNYTEAYNNRGNIFKNNKNYDRALEDYNKAIELNPKLTEAYNNRGVVFINKNRNADAISDFNKAIELKPNLTEAYNNRGVVFINENKNTEAISDVNKAIELDPDFADAYNNRGIIFYREKKYDEAISNYTKVIALQANNVLAYYNRGLSEYYSGKKDAACLDMKLAANLGYKPASDAITQICK
jgi:Tfp pilus assembly protein PilF